MPAEDKRSYTSLCTNLLIILFVPRIIEHFSYRRGGLKQPEYLTQRSAKIQESCDKELALKLNQKLPSLPHFTKQFENE